MAEGLSLPTDHGVVVSDLEPDGPAAHGGVETDDVIVAMNGKPMMTLHQLEANVYRLSPGAKINLRIQRGENQMDVPVITEEESGEELDALADFDRTQLEGFADAVGYILAGPGGDGARPPAQGWHRD